MLVLAAGISAVSASEPIDTLSYAFGHQLTLGTMAGKNDLMQSERDFEDYIRGVEDRIGSVALMSDSSYMMSYLMGAMEAVFMTDGMHTAKTEELPPFACIVAGLRKVGNGEISLPADTIAAMGLINELSEKEGVRPSELDEETRSRFFTAYGLMTPFRHGLQQYIEELNPGTRCVADRQAFALGMADALESATEPPKSAYDIGRLVSISVMLTAMDGEGFDLDSFVAGAKAAVGQGEEIIPRESVEQILERKYMQEDDAAVEVVELDDRYEKIAEYLDKLDVSPFTLYKVDWVVTAGAVAALTAPGTDEFCGLLSRLGISDGQIAGCLMAQAEDEDGQLYAAALSAIGDCPLPEGYKWFCGRTNGTDLTVGVMETVPAFRAGVHEAMFEFVVRTGVVSVPWTYDVADVLQWAKFTEANIGKYVAVEINGKFMFAPKVNQRISGGRCSIYGLSAEEINRLFSGAEKADKDVEVVELEEEVVVGTE